MRKFGKHPSVFFKSKKASETLTKIRMLPFVITRSKQPTTHEK